MPRKKQINKIILEFPTSPTGRNLEKEDKVHLCIRLSDETFAGKLVKNLNLKFEIDFFEFLEATMKDFNGKIKYEYKK